MRKVFVSGNFNILHPGHLRLLRFAKELGDHLVVGVNSDLIGGSAVQVSQRDRLESIRSISWVTEAILIEESVESVIKMLRPDFVVKGKEFESSFNPEMKILETYGGKLVFSSGESTFSSLDLIRSELNLQERKIIEIPKPYIDRHKIDLSKIHQIINNFNSLNVCIIGDLIVDEYIICDPLGMSQEDPTIVVTPIETMKYIGGAGIVAAHASGLGSNVHFLSVTGNDSVRDYCIQEFQKHNVIAELFTDESRPTTLKQRFRAQDKTLLRVSHLHQGSINKSLQKQIFKTLESIISNINLLVFSDFNYGCLPQELVNAIIELCNRKNVIMVADSQCSSQIGDVSRFKSMHLLTPTEREARVSLRDQEDGLVVLAEKLRIASNAKNIILKLGKEGALLHLEDKDGLPHTDRIPAMNSSPVDVAGAGDSMLISSSMAFAVGANPWEASFIGSIASAIQVSRLGNIPLTSDKLLRVLN